ncbi:unnamed protein product [Acidithrix sp. C25]|nr:unnamed protein product [Acidithrix sp. C25]
MSSKMSDIILDNTFEPLTRSTAIIDPYRRYSITKYQSIATRLKPSQLRWASQITEALDRSPHLIQVTKQP